MIHECTVSAQWLKSWAFDVIVLAKSVMVALLAVHTQLSLPTCV